MVERDTVDRVRSFNRSVTERVGALNDHYLARERPLGEARVLWEIGQDGCDVRHLRSRLGLDSGYLSRILRSLEAAGLITVAPALDDRRLRVARLTKQGRKERSLLDRRSDALAEAMLAPLSQGQQQRLVAAMGEVERLLTASLVEIRSVDPADPRARWCLERYYAELDARFDGGFDPNAHPFGEQEMRAPAGLFLMAVLRDAPVGCGALRFQGDEPTELKRLWVSPDVRGLGVGRRLLGALEGLCPSDRTRLDSNKALTEAIAMYLSAGYQEIAPFNDDPVADRWFEKQLRLASHPK